MPSNRPVLADVNVWLATVVEGHPHHSLVVRWWQGEVLPGRRSVCFCRITQLGLLRLLSNEAVMGEVRCAPVEAWRTYDRLLSQEPVEYLSEPAGTTDLLRAHSNRRDASASLWTDAYLAAFAQAADIPLATVDRGFGRFEGLRLERLG